MTSLIKEGAQLGDRILLGTAIIPILLLSLPQAASPQEAVWRIEEEPFLTIGGQASGPGSDLYGISGALLLEDGRIVVADQAARLVVFDADGTYLYTFGGRGRGPGEFQGIQWIQRLPGDSILVADRSGTARLSVFTDGGDLVRTITAAAFLPIPTFHGAFQDGTLLASIASPLVATTGLSLIRRELELLRFDPTGRQILGSLGTVPGGEMIRIQGGLLAPWSFRRTEIEVRSQEVYVTTGDRLDVRVIGADGDSLNTFEAPHEPTPFTAADLVRGFAGTRFEERVTMQAARAGWPRDHNYAAVSGLRVDDLGNVWVREFQSDRDAAGRWIVFDSGGDRIAIAHTPPRLWPFQIRQDFVLSVWRDALDVEHVQLRRIMKRGNP